MCRIVPGRAPDAVAFVGPTLAPRGDGADTERATEGVELRPPARRGDVLAAVADGARTIVLLDGYFFTVPSVTHKEILYALDCGVRVIGAASMGALRAAELEPFGMIGVGAIFERYRDGVLDGDDEVALLHAPAAAGYLPLTVALVEVRHALERLVREGAATREAADRLVAHLKGIGFVERSRSRVRSLARELLAEEAADALPSALEGPGLKRRDALAALELATAPDAPTPDGGLVTGGSGGRAPRSGTEPRRRTPVTGYLDHFKEEAVGVRTSRDDRAAPVAEAWAVAQVLHPDAPAFVRSIRLRFLLYSSAARAGLVPDASAIERTAREMAQAHRARLGRTILPPLDYREEARVVELSRAARRELGDRKEALAGLARGLRVDAEEPEESLLALLAGQPDAVTPWSFARAFSFDAAFPPARELVPPAREIHGCLKAWSKGASVAPESLVDVAADIWGCEPDDVPRMARERGLYAAPAASHGLPRVLELLAAAERLPEPINAYPEKRSILVATPMEPR